MICSCPLRKVKIDGIQEFKRFDNIARSLCMILENFLPKHFARGILTINHSNLLIHLLDKTIANIYR